MEGLYVIGYVLGETNKVDKLAVLDSKTEKAKLASIDKLANLSKQKKLKLENVVYNKSSNSFRGKYTSIRNLLEYKPLHNNVDGTVYVITQDSTAVAIQSDGIDLTVVVSKIYAGSTDITVKMHTIPLNSLIINKDKTYVPVNGSLIQVSNGIKCQTAYKSQSKANKISPASIKDKKLAWLKKTVSDKSVPWTMQDFTIYMNDMNYTYELGRSSERVVLSDISSKCKILHIPVGVDYITDMFNDKPSEDTVIIISSTVRIIVNLYKNKGDNPTTLKSIYFQKSEQKVLLEHELIGLKYLTITNEAELPSSKEIKEAYNHCKINSMDAEFTGKIKESFNEVTNSNITLRIRALELSKSFTEMDNVNLKIVSDTKNTNKGDVGFRYYLSQSIRECKNCRISIKLNDGINAVNSINSLSDCEVRTVNTLGYTNESFNDWTRVKSNIIDMEDRAANIHLTNMLIHSFINMSYVKKLKIRVKTGHINIDNVGCNEVHVISATKSLNGKVVMSNANVIDKQVVYLEHTLNNLREVSVDFVYLDLTDGATDSSREVIIPDTVHDIRGSEFEDIRIMDTGKFMGVDTLPKSTFGREGIISDIEAIIIRDNIRVIEDGAFSYGINNIHACMVLGRNIEKVGQDFINSLKIFGCTLTLYIIKNSTTHKTLKGHIKDLEVIWIDNVESIVTLMNERKEKNRRYTKRAKAIFESQDELEILEDNPYNLRECMLLLKAREIEEEDGAYSDSELAGYEQFNTQIKNAIKQSAAQGIEQDIEQGTRYPKHMINKVNLLASNVNIGNKRLNIPISKISDYESIRTISDGGIEIKQFIKGSGQTMYEYEICIGGESIYMVKSLVNLGLNKVIRKAFEENTAYTNIINKPTKHTGIASILSLGDKAMLIHSGLTNSYVNVALGGEPLSNEYEKLFIWKLAQAVTVSINIPKESNYKRTMLMYDSIENKYFNVLCTDCVKAKILTISKIYEPTSIEKIAPLIEIDD